MTQPQQQQEEKPDNIEQQVTQGNTYLEVLEPGEVLRETDLYWSTSGRALPVPCPGATVPARNNGVKFLRPIEKV